MARSIIGNGSIQAGWDRIKSETLARFTQQDPAPAQQGPPQGDPWAGQQPQGQQNQAWGQQPQQGPPPGYGQQGPPQGWGQPNQQQGPPPGWGGQQ